MSGDAFLQTFLLSNIVFFGCSGVFALALMGKDGRLTFLGSLISALVLAAELIIFFPFVRFMHMPMIIMWPLAFLVHLGLTAAASSLIRKDATKLQRWVMLNPAPIAALLFWVSFASSLTGAMASLTIILLPLLYLVDTLIIVFLMFDARERGDLPMFMRYKPLLLVNIGLCGMILLAILKTFYV